MAGDHSEGSGGKVASLRSSVQAAVGVNSSAFGFSITITGALAAVARVHGTPDGLEVLLFGAGGVTAFSLLDLIASEGFKQPLTRERPDTVTHAAALSFLSVLGGIGVAIGVAHVLGETLSWLLASFAAVLTFVLVVAFELTLAERVREKREGE